MNARILSLLALLTVAGSAALTASAGANPGPNGSFVPAGKPSGSADAEPAKTVRIHMETVKVTSGKSDGAEKTLKANMLKLRNACVVQAIKKTPVFEGTLLMTLDVADDGKIAKATPSVTAGKLPDELQQCAAKFYQEKIQLAASKAQIEATILMGPKVNQKD